MESTSSNALGLVVRDLRLAKGLTQAELGRDAGYHGGAGVTISRVEGGLLVPSHERLEGIAKALGQTASELLEQAAKRATAIGVEGRDAPRTIDERIAQIQKVNGRRQLLADAYAAYTDACGRAETAFLMPLREIAARMEGSQVEGIQHVGAGDADSDTTAETEAAYQLRLTTYGVKEALAKSSELTATGDETFNGFADTVAFSAMAAGAAVAGTGAASAVGSLNTALNVATSIRSATTKTRVAGAAVAGVLVVAGALAAVLSQSTTKRTKKQRQVLEESLTRVEAQVAETQPGFEALLALLPVATKVLDYVAVHASHALSRWEIGAVRGALDWNTLSEGDRALYQQFTEIAAAQLAAATISVRGLVESRGEELEQTRNVVNEVLSQSWSTITRYV